MPKFSLCITPKDLASFSWFDESFDLFFVTKISESGKEHSLVETKWHLLIEEECLFLEFNVMIVNELGVSDEFFGVDDHHFLPRSMNSCGIKAKDGVIIDNGLSSFELLHFIRP